MAGKCFLQDVFDSSFPIFEKGRNGFQTTRGSLVDGTLMRAQAAIGVINSLGLRDSPLGAVTIERRDG
jgi:hypothetical protein